MSSEMMLVLGVKFNGNDLAVGRLWNSPQSETKGAEAEMRACPHEVFSDFSLERDGANRKMGDTACPVESFVDSEYTMHSQSHSIP